MEKICTFDGCDRPFRTWGYCNMHYKRVLRHGDPSIARRRRGLQRDQLGRKMCVRCRQWLETTAFGKNKKNVDGLASYCRPCVAGSSRQRKYGLDDAAFAALIETQAGACAICRRPPANGAWHVDHDHACCSTERATTVGACGGCVRGLLCSRCNTALGLLDDDADRMRAAAEYVQGLHHSRAAITRGVA